MSLKSRWSRVAACVVLLGATACGNIQPKDDDPAASSNEVEGGGGGKAAPAKPVGDDMAVDPPGEQKGALLSSDVMVYSQNTLDDSTVEKIKAIKGVDAVEKISMGSFYVGEQEVTYAAVNPSTFWRFTPPGTAQTPDVWKRVAKGEIAVEPAIGRKVEKDNGFMEVGNASDAQTHPHRGVRRDPRPEQGQAHRRSRERQVGREAGHAEGQRDAGRDGLEVAAEHPQAAAEVRRRQGQRADPRPRPRHQRDPDRLPHRWQRGQGRRARSATRPTRTAPSDRTRRGSRRTSAPWRCRSSGRSPGTG